MTAFASLEHAKLKNWGAVASLESHVKRTKISSNVNPELSKNNKSLLHLDDAEKNLPIYQIIQNRIKKHCKKKIRKNAVLACGIVLNVSPEYFRPGDPKTPYTYDPERVEKWQQAATDWLLKKYGKKRLLSIDLHLDEATPHIHAVYIPFNEIEVNGEPETRLSAAAFIGKHRTAMSELQTEYAEAISHLGIERGSTKGTASYRDIREIYADIPEMKNLRAVKQNIKEQSDELENKQTQLSDQENRLRQLEQELEQRRRELEEQSANIKRQKQELKEQEAKAKQQEQQQQQIWATEICHWTSLFLATSGKHQIIKNGYDFRKGTTSTPNGEKNAVLILYQDVELTYKIEGEPARARKNLTVEHWESISKITAPSRVRTIQKINAQKDQNKGR